MVHGRILHNRLIHESAAFAVLDLHDPEIGIEFDLLVQPGPRLGFLAPIAQRPGPDQSPLPSRAWLSTRQVPSSRDTVRITAPASSAPLRTTNADAPGDSARRIRARTKIPAFNRGVNDMPMFPHPAYASQACYGRLPRSMLACAEESRPSF